MPFHSGSFRNNNKDSHSMIGNSICFDHVTNKGISSLGHSLLVCNSIPACKSELLTLDCFLKEKPRKTNSTYTFSSSLNSQSHRKTPSKPAKAPALTSWSRTPSELFRKILRHLDKKNYKKLSSSKQICNFNST